MLEKLSFWGIGATVVLSGLWPAPWTAAQPTAETASNVSIRFRVRVVNQETGKGVPRALVRAVNAYLEEGGLGAAREKQVDATANGNGEAILALTSPGTVEVWARALGYLSASPTRVRLPVEGGDDRAFEISLWPDEITVRLVLPGGAPASRADALLVADLAEGPVLFRTTADHAGLLKIPRHYEGSLVVKHPSAAFAVSPWRPRGDVDEDLQLPEPAAIPFQVRVTDSRGVAVPGAFLALWSQGQRLADEVLRFVTGGPSRTDRGGHWRAEGLPVGSLAVLAWSSDPGVQDLAKRGLLDFHSVAVDTPWPPVVEVRLAE
jgi:hypothetical protein